MVRVTKKARPKVAVPVGGGSPMTPRVLFAVGAGILAIAGFVVQDRALALHGAAILALAVSVVWPTG